MRFCKGCSQTDKRKNPPCKKGFEAIIGKTGEVIRPSKCKKKYKKVSEEDTQRKYRDMAVDAFQMYIRYRDNWTCVVCGKHINPNEEKAKMLLHAGHYISRGKTALLLDEKNVHAQCRECNGKQNWEGIDPRYTQYLIRKYGTEILDYFSQKKNEVLKLSHEQWRDLANFWNHKLERIKRRENEI